MRLWLVLCLLLSASVCHATWQQLAQLNSPIGCCFFIDDKRGFVGSGAYDANPVALKIWYTNNGGITWTACATPTEAGQVTQISIDSATGIGYASVFCMTNPNMNLWRTVDGGFTWTDVSSSQRFGTGVGYKGGVLTTASWSTGGQGNNGVFYMENQTLFVSPGPGVSNANEAWSAYGDATTQVWYQIKEMVRRLYASTDKGVTWTPRYNFTVQPTGHIHGKEGTIYVQTYAAGIFRSTDNGISWAAVGGPSNNVDTRSFWVTGCNGREVIAFGLNGEVWKTIDGGDGLLGTTNPIAISHITIPQISACAVSQGVAKLIYKDCGELIITSATIQNDPNGVFTLQPVTVPDTLQTGDTAYFTVDFDPRGNPLAYNGQIRVLAKQVRGGIATDVDSLIRIGAIAAGVPPKLTSSHSSISFRELSVCEPGIDTVITLRNEGCDTLTITSGPTSAAAPFTVEQLPSPLIVPPDSVVTFRIAFKPDVLGTFSTSTVIQASSQGKQQQIEILLDGRGRAGEGVLSIPQASHVFLPVSICSGDTLRGFITNIGCDTLIFDSTVITGDQDFTIVSPSFISGYKLRPGDTIWFAIELTPLQKGSRSGNLKVNLHNEHGTFLPSIGNISFTAMVLDGTRSITQSLTAIDFDTTDLCSELDSIFTLRNTGCDTITLTGAALQGTGFELQGLNLPLVLAPGQTITINVNTKIDTTGNQTQSSGTITFTSNATNALTPVQLTRSYRFAKTFGIRLAMLEKQGTSGAIVTLSVIGEQGLGAAGSGVQTVNATLALNEDLLHYVSAQSPNTVTFTGQQITIANPVELTTTPTGTLADLTYEVHLTKDSTTDIVLSSVSINDGDTSACASQIQGGGSLGNGGPAFVYSYRCGDHAIQKFLETGASPINIILVRPNPAHDEITFEVSSTSKETFMLEVYTDAGELLSSHEYQSSTMKLPVAQFVEGSYTARIVQAGTVAVARFVVVR